MNATVTHKGPGGSLPRQRRLSRHSLASRPAGAALAATGAVLLLTPALAVPAAAVSGAGPAAGAAAAKPSAANQLFAVSCPTPHTCVAVGDGASSDGMLAEGWNGSQWSLMNVPLPAGAASGGLTGVSCTSATACTAVGYSATSANISSPLAERWNGRDWTVQPAPSPGDAGIPFAAVSCGSATSCTAVGYYDFGDISFTDSTLVEHWDGTSWAIQSTPPIGDPGSDLTSVSCLSASLCTAAGYFLGQSDEGPGSSPLAMRWRGTSWAIQHTPGARDAASNGTTGLSGVSCPAVNACVAVGANIDENLMVFGWDGRRWSRQRIAGQRRKPELSGVSCSSASACTTVGSGLVERWNGRSWFVQHVPSPSAATGITMNAVSCPSKLRCTAVGFASTSQGMLTLAERWNGHSWAPQATPN